MKNIFTSIRKNNRANWISLSVIPVLIIIWQLASTFGWINPIFFPAPSTVFMTAVDLSQTGELPKHLAFTLFRMSIGFFIGTLSGLILGMSMGWAKPLRVVLDPIISIVYPLPKITLLPLIMLIIGIGEQTVILIIALSAFFPVLINTMAGVMNINPIYFDVARNYGAHKTQIFTKVILPGSLSYSLAGIRLALGMSLLMVVIVELAMANKGLGALLWLSWSTFRIDRIYVAIAIIAALSLIFGPLLGMLYRRLIPWKED